VVRQPKEPYGTYFVVPPGILILEVELSGADRLLKVISRCLGSSIRRQLDVLKLQVSKIYYLTDDPRDSLLSQEKD
jgi:hypothetical protein